MSKPWHVHHRRLLHQTGMNPEWLRYYFAAKLNASMEDLDLNLDDFIARVNRIWSATRQYRQPRIRLFAQTLRGKLTMPP